MAEGNITGGKEAPSVRQAAVAKVAGVQNNAFGAGPTQYRPSYQGKNPYGKSYQRNQKMYAARREAQQDRREMQGRGSGIHQIPPGGQRGTGAGTYYRENAQRA